MKIVKGWRKIDRQRGFVNETTGQNLVVTKKEFGEHYVALLFPRVRIDDKGETISPAYATASKAEAYALDWMEKHPVGAGSVLGLISDGGDENEQEKQPSGESNRQTEESSNKKSSRLKGTEEKKEKNY